MDPIKLEEATKQDLKGKAVEGVGPEEAKQEAPFQASFGEDDVLTMRLDLKIAVLDQDKLLMLRGYMDTLRDQAISLIHKRRQMIAAEKEKIIRLDNKQGHKSFVGKLFKH